MQSLSINSNITISAEHALGSAMLRGGELEQIQFLLGHVSVQTTRFRRGWSSNG